MPKKRTTRQGSDNDPGLDVSSLIDVINALASAGIDHIALADDVTLN